MPDYRWNETAQRYIGPNGRFVSRQLVSTALEQSIDTGRNAMRALGDRLVKGEISPVEFRDAMRQEIKSSLTASAAMARGGRDQMSPSDWGWVGSEVKKQYQYLDNFVQQVQSGKQPLNGRVPFRAGMYGDAARAVFEEMARRMARIHGAVDERRVLQPYAEHCTSDGFLDGCVELATRGWQPVGVLPRIGGARCRTHCQCHFEFRDAGGKKIGV